MAWETVTYMCGHEGEVQLYGNRASRDSKIKWYSTNVNCPECAEKILQDRIRIQAGEMGLPELAGSEKQIDWAGKIRYEKLFDSEYNLRAFASGRHDNLGDYAEQAYNEILGNTSAHWWIENRDKNLREMLRDVAKDISMRPPEGADEVSEEETVTVNPDVEDRKDGIVTVAVNIDESEVSFKYPKSEAFRSVVKKCGCRFDGVNAAWTKSVGVRTGSAANVIAVVGNALLAKGFSVCFPDQASADAAVKGEGKPFAPGSVTLTKDGDFCLWWPGANDDLYYSSKRLLGARWEGRNNGMVVPVTSYRQVLDYADLYHFAVSDKAAAAAEAAREIASKVTAIAKAGKAEDAAGAAKQALKDRLKGSAGILEDLMDDDD